MPRVCRGGGMFKLWFDWYISLHCWKKVVYWSLGENSHVIGLGMLTRVLSSIPDWLVRKQWDLQQENWHNISWSSQANREERILPFFIPFPNSAHKQNLLKKSRAMNWFVKMEWQISVQPVRDVGHLQWSQIFPWDRGEMDLWISLLTKISHELDSTWHLQIADYI